VDAVVNAERGFLKAEMVPICQTFGGELYRPVGDKWTPLSNKEIISGEHLKYWLKVTNLGRTAALVDEIKLHSEYLKEDRSNLFSLDRSSLTIIDYDHAISGSESTDLVSVDVKEWTDELVQKAGDGNKIVLLYGVVEYFHIFNQSDRQECWFRYLFDP
jgi:hypothetical protein